MAKKKIRKATNEAKNRRITFSGVEENIKQKAAGELLWDSKKGWTDKGKESDSYKNWRKTQEEKRTKENEASATRRNAQRTQNQRAFQNGSQGGTGRNGTLPVQGTVFNQGQKAFNLQDAAKGKSGYQTNIDPYEPRKSRLMTEELTTGKTGNGGVDGDALDIMDGGWNDFLDRYAIGTKGQAAGSGAGVNGTAEGSGETRDQSGAKYLIRGLSDYNMKNLGNTGKTVEEVARPGNRGVLEYGEDSYAAQSARAQLEDENSYLNQVYRWRTSKPDIEDYTLDNANEYDAWIDEGRRLRQFDQGDDPEYWSSDKLQRKIDEKEQAVAAQKAAAPKSESEARGMKQRADEIQSQQGRYLALANGELEDVRGLSGERFITKRPDNYEDYDEKTAYYDSLIYDFVHGRDGAFQDVLENGTPEEQEAAAAEVDELWARMENGTIRELAEDPTLEEERNRTIDALTQRTTQEQAELERYRKLLNRQSTVEELERNASGDGAYHPENAPEVSTRMTTEGDMYRAPGGDQADQAYYYINNNWLQEQESITGEEMGEGFKPYWSVVRNEYFLTDEQRKTFNQYYNSGDKESALAYLDGLNATLNSRRGTYQEFYQRELADGNYGAIEGAATVLAAPITGAVGLVGTALAALGNEEAADPYSRIWDLGRWQATTRDERGNVWAKAFSDAFGGSEAAGQAGKFLNGVLYSMADNMVSMGLTKGIAGAAGVDMASRAAAGIMQVIMSSEATSASMLQGLKDGKGPVEAAVYAVGDGVIEAITEKYSISELLGTDPKDLLGNWRSIAGYLGKNAVAEGSEEVASDLLGTTFDAVVSVFYDHENEIESRVRELTKNGTMSEKDAMDQVLKEYIRDLGTSFLGGAISGLGLSGGNVAMSKAGTVFESYQGGRAAIDAGNLNTMLEAAAQVNGGEAYQKQIGELRAAYEQNGTLSTRQAMTLYKTMRNTNLQMVDEVANQAATDVMHEVINAKIMESGRQASGQQVTEASQAAAELLTGEGNLTRDQKEALKAVPEAMEAVQEVMTEGSETQRTVGERIGEATAPIQRSNESLREAGRRWEASGAAQRAEEKAEVATEEEKRAATGTSTGSATEVIADGEYAEIVRKEGGNYVVRTSEGTEKTVDAANVRATGKATATILSWGEQSGNAVSDRFVNTALNMSKATEIQDTGRFLDQAMGIRLAAYTGQSLPQTSLRSEVAQALYSTSLQDAQAERATATANQITVRAGEGKATFGGAEYGSEGWTKALDQAGLTKAQKNQAGALAEIYHRIGLNVDFIADAENDAVFGSYNAQTGTTTINLAGTNTNGEQHHAMVTAGHEMTHWLEQNAGEAYDQLRSYVLESMGRKGVNVNQAILNKMENYNAALQKAGESGISIDGAIAEIVADSCDQILGSEEVIAHIQETRPTLYNSIKSFVKNFVARVRNAMGGMNLSSSREARLFLNDTNELAKKWLGAYDSAISQQIRQAEETSETNENEGSNEQFALRDKDRVEIVRSDEDLKEARKKVAGMQSVATIEESDYQRFLDGDFIKNGKEYFSEIGGIAHNDILGDVELSTSGLRHIVGRNDLSVIKAMTVPAIKAVIEKGEIVNIDNNHNGKPVDTALIAGQVTMPDGGYVVGVVVAQDNGGTKGQKNRYSFHNAFAIKKSNSIGSMAYTANADGSVTYSGSSNIISILQEIAGYNVQSGVNSISSTEESNEILKKNGEISGGTLQYSLAGASAGGGFADDVQRAREMEQNGATEAEITEATGCIKGYNGQWWRVLDNGNMHVSEVKENSNYRLENIYDASELYEAYPYLRRMNVEFTNLSRGELGQHEGNTIRLSNELISQGNDQIEAVLQHELQHEIQRIERSYSGSSVTFWKDMQNIAHARMYTNGQAENEIYRKYDLNPEDLSFGIEFNEDGSVNEEWLFPEQREKVRNMTQEDLDRIKAIDKDSEKWAKLIRGNKSPIELYINTVGETEARAAERTGEDQYKPIPYGDNAITTEEYTGRNVRQYSIRTEGDSDVMTWMDGLSEESLQSEAEKKLLRSYQGLRSQMAESQGKQAQFRTELEEARKALSGENFDTEGRSAAQLRDAVRRATINIETETKRYNRLQQELYRVTSGSGYAGMMYRQNRIMRDFVSGRTQEQVRSTVSAMVEEIGSVQKELTRRGERLENLAQQKDVAAVRSFFSESGTTELAKQLRDTYKSGMKTQEIGNALADIALKMKAGKDFTAEVNDLAASLMSTQQAEAGESYILNELRGTVIRLTPTQMKQLKAEGGSLNEIRSTLQGTGIRVQTAGDSTNTLDKNWDSMCDRIPSLNRDAADTDMLGEVLRVVEGEMQTARSAAGMSTEAYREALAETAGDVAGYAALLKEGMAMPKDAGAQNQIRQIMRYMMDMATEAEDSAKAIREMEQKLASLGTTGLKTRAAVSVLERDLTKAVDYYDSLVKQEAANRWNEERQQLVDQLESKAAKELLKEQGKWQKLIETNRRVRELTEEKNKYRSRIGTVVRRLDKLLTGETDQQNIPEDIKPLAREVLRMIVSNDAAGMRKITRADHNQLMETKRLLDIWQEQGDSFDVESIEWSDDDIKERVLDDLAEIEDGILYYNAGTGRDTVQLEGERYGLRRIQEALSDIYTIIQSARSIDLDGRKVLIDEQAFAVEEAMDKSRFKGELLGKGGAKLTAAQRAVVYGNMTPEYFFKNLRNAGMTQLWEEFHRGENQNGLEVQKAKERMAEIAAKYGYGSWDLETRRTLELQSGAKVQMNDEQLMALWATWKREQTVGPEMSMHLTMGGFVVDEGQTEGRLRREQLNQRPRRVTTADMQQVESMLTAEQKGYVDEVVGLLSHEMSELGNEASLRMYGIKKYMEKYYFPFTTWDGTKSLRSDQGTGGTTDNRAAHKGWSKRRMDKARNALSIGNFTETAVRHMTEMINYNTMAVPVENMNRVLNYQLIDGQDELAMPKSVRTMFGEAYGRNALDYLETLQQDINGGVGQRDNRKTLSETMLSVFKKNAVAGSLSVAAQQPLSYIRASMMISPKYLAGALNPAQYRGSYAEMLKYSGVAVIKEMGRFDMNFGQSARDYIQPEAKTSKARQTMDWISDKSTILPELMDRMTWTRMWTACKLEQQAKNQSMNYESDEFLEKVAERFNDVMRKTQVYDSVLVKSANMRSQKQTMKALTSFMAEPTLTINVLTDAVRNTDEPGGKKKLAVAAVTYLMSAAAQAVVKGLFSAGRSPDDDRTKEENILNKVAYNFIGEVNPLGLIPGYSDLIDLIMNGEISDDAMSVIGKFKTITQSMTGILTGKSKKGIYRDWEDSVAQLAQLFTNVPAKNLMRDARAMYNLLANPSAYNTSRATSAAVLKWQVIDTLNTSDMLGAINSQLGDAGYKTTNDAYYDRIYKAKKAGDTAAAEEMSEYLLKAKLKGNNPEQTLRNAINSRAKQDENATTEEKIAFLQDNGAAKMSSYILDQYADGQLDRAAAEKLYKEQNPDMSADDIWFDFDRTDYKKETGNDPGNGKYYRLYDAIDQNKSEAITGAVKTLTSHGVEEKDIAERAGSYILKKYADGQLDRAAAEKLYKEQNPDMSADDIWFDFDRTDYKKETGNDPGNGKYYRLYDAIDQNKSEAITGAVKTMTSHGMENKNIKSQITKKYKADYMALKDGSKEKVAMKDALVKAYKAVGMTAGEASELISGWKKDK